MKTKEDLDNQFGDWLGKLGGRLTNLHCFVQGHLFNDRTIRKCEEWEELEKGF
ncbi:MAG: hypothetical protein ACK42Z_03765 [Candidatus Kapaibacteriota bacterium]